MVYATNAQFAQRSGLGVRVIDENVGTGAGTTSGTQSFDLDKDHIIAGTYTLSHAPSGSNVFKTLVETQDYTLDKDSGRILIVGTTGTSGSGALGVDTVYATYIYIEDFSNDVVTDLLSNATDQIDKLTGRRWTTGTAVTEYRDGKRTSEYPTTDQPYMSDR